MQNIKVANVIIQERKNLEEVNNELKSLLLLKDGVIQAYKCNDSIKTYRITLSELRRINAQKQAKQAIGNNSMLTRKLNNMGIINKGLIITIGVLILIII